MTCRDRHRFPAPHARGAGRDRSRPRLDRARSGLARSRLPPLLGVFTRSQYEARHDLSHPAGVRFVRALVDAHLARETSLPDRRGYRPTAICHVHGRSLYRALGDREQPPSPERISGTHRAPAALPRLRPRTRGPRLAPHRAGEGGLLSSVSESPSPPSRGVTIGARSPVAPPGATSRSSTPSPGTARRPPSSMPTPAAASGLRRERIRSWADAPRRPLASPP